MAGRPLPTGGKRLTPLWFSDHPRHFTSQIPHRNAAGVASIQHRWFALDKTRGKPERSPKKL